MARLTFSVITKPPSGKQASLEAALRHAKSCCEKKGARLTPLRKQVLSIILAAERPIGAYEIMSELQEQSSRDRVAPPTVYRSLEFLLSVNCINRVHTLNAYIPRRSGNSNELAAIFICRHCGFHAEAANRTVQQSLNLSANELKFEVENQALEIVGCCANCRLEKQVHD